jgi:hypothetical protein
VGTAFGQVLEPASGRTVRYYSPASNVLVGLSVLVERGGKRTLRSRLADEQVGIAEAQVLDALRLQLFQLRQAFLSALLARANLEVAFGNRQSLDRTEALLRRQWREGAVPEGDLLRFQASRLPFEADITAGAQAYAAGVAAVAALLGEDAAVVQAGAGQSGALNLPALAAPPSSRPGPTNAPTTVRTVLSPVAFDLRGRFAVAPELGVGREELARAISIRADVVAAERQVAASAANTRLAEASRLRDVTVNGTAVRSQLPQDIPDAARRVDAINQFSVSLSIPIFTARIVEGNVTTAQAQQGQAEALSRAALLGRGPSSPRLGRPTSRARASRAVHVCGHEPGGGSVPQHGTSLPRRRPLPRRRAGRAAGPERHAPASQPSAARLPPVPRGAGAGQRGVRNRATALIAPLRRFRPARNQPSFAHSAGAGRDVRWTWAWPASVC